MYLKKNTKQACKLCAIPGLWQVEEVVCLQLPAGEKKVTNIFKQNLLIDLVFFKCTFQHN